MVARNPLAGLGLVLAGVIMILMALPNLYYTESGVYASGDVLMGDSPGMQSGVLNLIELGKTFHRFRNLTDVKQVEVIVSQVSIPYYTNGSSNPQWQISSPFTITLTNEQDQTGLYTIDYTIPNHGLLGGPVRHVFDFPAQWTSMSSVIISNPDNILTGATVTVILHKQVLNASSQSIMIAGFSGVIVGTAIAIVTKKRKTANSESS